MRRTIREAAVKDGLPRRAFAYAPAASPGSWKLPIYLADGSVDEARLPAAAAALSAGGFRGEKADIPSADLPMVKAKIRAAYRKWKGSDAEYPASITEAFAEGTCYGCNHPTACDCECECANHVPESLLDIQQALDALEDLYGLLAGEFADGDVEGADLIQVAIDALLKFIPAEGRELRASAGAAGAMTEAGLDVDALLVTLEEVGKRNRTSDQKMIQTIHDHTHDLGATHDGKPFAVAEAIAFTGDSAPVAIAESSEQDGAFVLLSEAAATFDDASRTVTITPIRPGFGNKRDKFYYPTDTLREATNAGLFNSLKMFRNHPRRSDEKDLPERDVKDWFATTREAAWDDRAQAPRLPVVVHDEADYRRWKEAPEQIAFSIRGGGYARPGTVDGQEARIVESLAKIRSVDWVTEAGAGGAITFAESAAEEFEMDIKALSTEQLREELRLREAEAAVAEPPADTQVEEPPAAEPEAPAADATIAVVNLSVVADAPVVEKAPDGYVSREEFDALKTKLATGEVKEAAAKALAEEMATSTLPKNAKEIVAARFTEAGWGGGFVYTDEPAFRGAVKGELATAAKMLATVGKGPSPVKGLGGAADSSVDSIREAVVDRLAKKWGTEQMPSPTITVIRADDMGKEPTAVAADTGDDASVSESAVQTRIAAKFGF
jgi:hypothetical protein